MYLNYYMYTYKSLYFYTREYVIQLVLRAMKSPFIQPVEEDSEEKVSSVEPRYNEEPRDWQNMFLITRFHYYQGYFPYILLLLG